MDDKIFELLSEDSHYPNDEAVASEWEQVEEEQASVKGLFDYMRNGYTFLDHCGSENL